MNLLQEIKTNYRLSLDDLAEMLDLNSRQAVIWYIKTNRDLKVKQVMKLKKALCKIKKEQEKFEEILKKYFQEYE